MVALTWAQFLALAFALPVLLGVFLGFYLGRLRRTDRAGVERLVFPLPDDVDPHAERITPRRRWTDAKGPA